MPEPTNEQLIRRWFEEVWNQQRAATIDELMTEDARIHGHVSQALGRSGFRELHTTFCTAFPDIRITPELVFGSGDLVVAHNKVEGTHSGTFLGIPPTHRRVSFTGTSIGRVKDGKFVEAWDAYNFLELYGQLDALEHISALRKAGQQ